jgi:hypothetical protein
VAFALAFETEEQSLSAATNDRKAAPMRSARGFFWQCVEDMRRVETQGMPSRVFTLTWPVARFFFCDTRRPREAPGADRGRRMVRAEGGRRCHNVRQEAMMAMVILGPSEFHGSLDAWDEYLCMKSRSRALYVH